MQAQLKSSHIRAFCELIYKPISPATWNRWREKAGVKGFSQLLTEHQAKVLITIAYVRLQEPPDSKKRKPLINYEWHIQPYMDDAMEYLRQACKQRSLPSPLHHERPNIHGSDVIDFMRSKGWNPPSQATLYRRLKGFSKRKNRYYSESEIKAIAG